MFNKLKNGYIAEEKFALECMSRDIPISRPITNTEPYDFIVESNGRFCSVQVKKSWVDEKGRNVVCIKSSYPRSQKTKSVSDQKNVDYLAVLVNYWDWFIIPRDALGNARSTICVRKLGKYSEFYNNWEFK